MQFECFLASAASVNAEAGSGEVSLEEAEVKRHFAASARQTLLCVDSSKLGQWSLGSALSLAEVSVLVTELDPGDVRLDAYRALVEIR